MFVQELCDVSSSLTASSSGLIYGQCVFSGVDRHFQTGPLGFQLSRSQSESALYRTLAWGHSLPHAPQPRFRSSCYYGQSNPILLHTHTHSARCTSAFGCCILGRTQAVGLLLMLPALLWFTQWCSLAFCSEYTVLFSPPSLIRTHPRATPHGTTTLTNA